MACYLCGGKNLEVVRTRLRNDVARNVFQCADCGINYLEPKERDLTEYYRREYRDGHSPVIGKKLTSRETFDIYRPMQNAKIDVIRDRLTPSMKVLDVGCSTGHFLHEISPFVGECVGIEFNEENARFVNEELGYRVYTVPIEVTPVQEGYFDLITAFHVVEHVEDPIALLKTLSRYLQPGGLLYVEVPNLNDALLSAYEVEDYASFWFREPHIFNFSPDTFCRVLERAGFTGEISTIQRYNFVNHLSWIMTGKPQSSAQIGMGAPTITDRFREDDSGLGPDLRDWASKADEQYREILSRHSVGDSIVFVGGVEPSERAVKSS